MAAGLCSLGALSPAHPKGPEAKDDDDEVDDVSQEHESIDVGGCAVLGVQDVMEETSQGPVHTLGPERGWSRPQLGTTWFLPPAPGQGHSQAGHSQGQAEGLQPDPNCPHSFPGTTPLLLSLRGSCHFLLLVLSLRFCGEAATTDGRPRGIDLALLLTTLRAPQGAAITPFHRPAD